jgi:hypothetical protein
MKSTIDILIEARNLILDINHWTQGMPAKASTGYSIDPKSPDACAWCADGALQRAAGNDYDAYYDASLILAKVARESFFVTQDSARFSDTCAYIHVNDGGDIAIDDKLNLNAAYTLSHANILRCFDLAITREAGAKT